MICEKCNVKMEGIAAYDDCSKYAFNVYLCDGCGSICKQDVWTGKGYTWVYVDNTVKREERD